MEIVTIEKRTFNELTERFKKLTLIVGSLCRESDDKRMSKWLDNQDVCTILNVSLRTIQTYRDSGLLPYSQIGHKMFYKPEDVEEVIQKLSAR